MSPYGIDEGTADEKGERHKDRNPSEGGKDNPVGQFHCPVAGDIENAA
jgi:hypothetical protein